MQKSGKLKRELVSMRADVLLGMPTEHKLRSKKTVRAGGKKAEGVNVEEESKASRGDHTYRQESVKNNSRSLTARRRKTTELCGAGYRYSDGTRPR